MADRWLDRIVPADVAEVGAVTPYYWPRRVPMVVDPADRHVLVTDRRSIGELWSNSIAIIERGGLI